MQELVVRAGVLQKILHEIGERPPETGGLLGMQEETVVRFWFDAGGVSLPHAYLPDISGCEAIINGPWRDEGVQVCGFVHSHRDMPCPSVPDRRYMYRLCQAMGRETLILCILQCCEAPRLHAWCMRPGADEICSAVELSVRVI